MVSGLEALVNCLLQPALKSTAPNLKIKAKSKQFQIIQLRIKPILQALHVTYLLGHYGWLT